MSIKRLIGRLDIKGKNLIKGIHLEGLRVIGSPNDYAIKYYHEGIDELIFMDAVASLYGRNNLTDVITLAAKNVFIPITVGGGIRSIEDVKEILRSGADKVAINTAAVKNPKLITEVARKFGSQCLVLSVEAKKISSEKWEVYIDNGREKTGIDVLDWVTYSERLGAGEVLLTSVDQEGTGRGFDVDLIKAVTNKINIPVIASGGMGHLDHLSSAFVEGAADAIAIAKMIHYNHANIKVIRDHAKKVGIEVRDYE